MLAGLAVLVVMAAYVGLPHLPEGWALLALLLVSAMQAYVGWTYVISVASHMAQLAPNAVPIAISLNMAAISIGQAVAAAVGGILVDTWGGTALPLAGMPMVILALIVWRAVPDGSGK